MLAANDQPKLVSHCAVLYAKLDSEAKAINGEEVIVNDSKITLDSERIWQGKIIDTCRSIGITPGSYSRVVNALRTLGCIEQVEQGYRGKPSIYRIHYPPTPEVWRDHAPDRTEDLTSGPSYDTMAAQLRDLEKQLGGINIVDALLKIEQGLTAIRKDVNDLQKRLPTAST